MICGDTGVRELATCVRKSMVRETETNEDGDGISERS